MKLLKQLFILTIFSVGLFSSNLFALDKTTDDEEISEVANKFNSRIANASSEYLVTCGDVYQLNFAIGSNPISYTILVDSTYTIKIANLGSVNGAGKTFLQLKKQVEEIVNRNYPMGGVQFLIKSPSIFNIVIKGEVSKTQERQVWALDRLSSVFSGIALTEKASTRFVKVTSKDGKEKVYDLFKYDRYGDFGSNPYLRPDDTVEIIQHKRIASVDGCVKREGVYELEDGENLKALIEKYADGLGDRADFSRLNIRRSHDVTETNKIKIFLSENDIKNDFELFDMDEFSIATLDSLEKKFYIEGAVGTGEEKEELTASNKFALSFYMGDDYGDYIRANKQMFSTISDLKNAYIIRGTEIIPVNIENILYEKTSKTGIKIEPYDILRIPFRQFFVTVAGSVVNPGRYPYIPDRTYEYYIGLAGGFNRSQNSMKSVSIVDINNNKVDKKAVIEPETTITANANSFTYYFNTYAPIVTTALTAVSTVVTIIAVFGNK